MKWRIAYICELQASVKTDIDKQQTIKNKEYEYCKWNFLSDLQ